MQRIDNKVGVHCSNLMRTASRAANRDEILKPQQRLIHIQIIDRHAKLFGLDAPTEIVVHTPTQTELEAWVSQMLAGTLPPVHEYDIITGQIVEDDGAVSTG